MLFSLDKYKSPEAANLHRLFWLRNIAIVGQCAAVAYTYTVMQIPLYMVPICLAIGFLAVVNGATYMRLRNNLRIADREIAIQLLIDISVLGVLLFFSGGYSNPFVSLFLLPLIIAAVTLPSRYTWGIAVITVCCYTALMIYFVPLQTHNHFHDFKMHLIGMWLTFVLSAVLVAYFVTRMNRSIRERDRQLAQAKEVFLRNERIVALGTLAAGAAHELGTPLSTMAVITKDLVNQCANDAELVEDLTTLSQQVRHCKSIIAKLLTSAGTNQAKSCCTRLVNAYMKELLDKLKLLRPDVGCHYQTQAESGPQIIVEETLSQALMNLLNNAADASPTQVELHSSWDHRTLCIQVLDRGQGMSGLQKKSVGQVLFSTKAPERGIGMGIYLAQATIERLGGKLSFSDRPGGGLCATVLLTLAENTQGKLGD